jgi:DNA-binding HxlR family transcriptional regulator
MITTAKTRTCEAAAEKEALVREMLERVGDKWTLLVIEELGSGGEMRFTQLWTWVEKHMKDVERSRRAYDRENARSAEMFAGDA